MALSSLAINYRVNKGKQHASFDDMKKAFNAEQIKEEDATSIPIPMSAITQKDIELNLHMTMMSTLKIIGLDINNDTPHKEGLSQFLVSRYNYWSDDIEHENYLD